MKWLKGGLIALVVGVNSLHADNRDKTKENVLSDSYDMQEYVTYYSRDGSIATSKIIYWQGCMCNDTFHYVHKSKTTFFRMWS